MTSGGTTSSLSQLRAPVRWWLRVLQSAAIAALLLMISPGTTANRAVAAPSANGAHVYMLRGILNVFSLGLDDIASKLESQGIPVTVINYLGWSGLADDIAADYRSGKVKTIIVVGHSSGATYLPDLVGRLDKLGAPVRLAIGLDSVFRTSLSGRVGRYVNYYIGNGNGEPVARTKDLRGSLENVNVQSVPGVGHVTIEKNEIMQRKVIADIDAVVFGGRPKQAAATQGATR